MPLQHTTLHHLPCYFVISDSNFCLLVSDEKQNNIVARPDRRRSEHLAVGPYGKDDD